MLCGTSFPTKWKGHSPPTPPKGRVWRKQQEWRGCALHNLPWEADDECDCRRCADARPPLGCTCEDKGHWYTYPDQWDLGYDMSGFSKLLTAQYMPSIKAQLMKEIYFGREFA